MRFTRIHSWDASKLPFLEEKLEFRERNIDGLDRDGVVLCMYGGEEARLTLFYAKKFRSVIAVDKDFSQSPPLPQNVVRYETTDRKFLKIMNSVLPKRLEILDVDPYGSPMLFIKEFFRKYRGIVRRLIITDGALTNAKMRLYMNTYKHYNLLPDRTIKLGWHYKHWACIVFSGIKDIVQDVGYIITYFDYEYNRYRTAIYARFDLEKTNG